MKILLTFALIALASPALAQDYPTRPIKAVTTTSAGGISDVFMRALGDELLKRWGQPIVVENRPGGMQNVGARACTEAPPDGYTICILNAEPIAYNQFLLKSMPFDPEKGAARLKLPVAKKPVFAKIGPRVGLGYRRNKTAGTWVLRVADGKGGNWTKAIGNADDFEEADGNNVLDFWQAQDRARAIARVLPDGDGDDGKPITVSRALDRYEADLKTRGGDSANVARVRAHLREALASKRVALLTGRDLRNWRDSLATELAPATVNRTATALKAALNLVADHDERIVSRQAWDMGLATIPDAQEPRNVILPEARIHGIISEAYQESDEFGLLVEVAAVTGARVSQLARLEVQDLQCDRTDPRLMMPSSRKGRGQKKITRRPVPIPTALAARLRSVVADKPANAPLLPKPNGTPWNRTSHSRPFRRTAIRAGFDPSEVTSYALRHSAIVRQILAGVPIRVVAVNHDTSITMLERTYSRYIGDHSDALARRALLDTTVSPNDKVVPIVTAR